MAINTLYGNKNAFQAWALIANNNKLKEWTILL